MKLLLKRLLTIVLVFALPISCIAQEPININARSVLLMEASSGRIIYESNSHESLPPASVTKIMTMLLLFEAIERGDVSYDTIVTASQRAKEMGGSTMFLDTNEKISVDDLLKGIAVVSANDGCVAVAEHLCGTVENFVERMNERASELGMKDTHFVNCNGLDDENHYTSAYDIALMSRELLKHKDVFKYTTIWMDTIRNGEFQLANTNKLIRFYDGANGLKTGSTSKAGNCISATAKRDGMQLIAVVLGAPSSKDRFSTASELLNYGFANYSVTQLGEKGEHIKEIKVINGKEDKLLAVAENNSSVLLKKEQIKNVKTHINLPEELNAPIKKGEIIGEVVMTLDGETLVKENIIAKTEIKRKNIYDYFIESFKSMFRVE